VLLILIAACSALILLAPRIGLGQGYDFILYRHFGVWRGLALQLLVWPVVCFLLYEILAIGVRPPPGRMRVLAVLKSAWSDGSAIARTLFSQAPPSVSRPELRLAIWLLIVYAAAFSLFLSKSLVWFKSPPDQHWWQAMLDYGMGWGTPIFSFSGNAL